METYATATAFETLDDDALLGRLLTAGDRLPREAVDEAARRGERLVAGLRDIIRDGHNWDRVDAGWWSVVHAVHILGCIEGDAATAALLEAFDRCAERDHDWLFEEWPSILGRRGPGVLESLRSRVDDIFADPFWLDRAICGMAAVASRHPERRAEVFGYIAELLADEDFDPDVRCLAAHVFLDFRLKEHKGILLELAGHPDNDKFKASQVHEFLAPEEPDLQWYQHDWLEFYNPTRIAERQARWESERPDEEDAWWYAMAELTDEESDEEIPGRKKAKSALSACLPLAERLREASETLPEYCPDARLPAFAALAIEAGAQLRSDRRLLGPLLSYAEDLEEWLSCLPETLTEAGFYAESVAVCDAWAVFLTPSFFLGHRALALAKAGRREEAQAQIQRTTRLFGSRLNVQLTAAESWMELGLFDEAERAYKTALHSEDIIHNDDVVNALLAKLYRRAGRISDAEALEKELREQADAVRRERELRFADMGTIARSSPKIGRNDPCPCVSGKKHKKCCLT